MQSCHLLVIVRFLLIFLVLQMPSGCSAPSPNRSQIVDYIEDYQSSMPLVVEELSIKKIPNKQDAGGALHVFGKLKLSETLYVKDSEMSEFKKRFARQLRDSHFSEQEITHPHYQRILRSSIRPLDQQSGIFDLLKVARAKGALVNFSAKLSYQSKNQGFTIDGHVRRPRLEGRVISTFSNPVIVSTAMVDAAVQNALMSRSELQKKSDQVRAQVKRLWLADYGINVVGVHKSKGEPSTVDPLRSSILHLQNVEPIELSTQYAREVFKLGVHTTSGRATCLRTTLFKQDRHGGKLSCARGQQIPVSIVVNSELNAVGEFVTLARLRPIREIANGLVGEFESWDLNLNPDALQADESYTVHYLAEPFALEDYNQRVVVAKASPKSATPKSNLEPKPKSKLVLKPKLEEKLTGAKLISGIQLELIRLKIYRLVADGVNGPETRRSIRHFQSKKNLAVDGLASQSLLTDLRATPTGSIETLKTRSVKNKKRAQRKPDNIVLSVIKKTGKAISNSVKWLGGKIKGKD